MVWQGRGARGTGASLLARWHWCSSPFLNSGCHVEVLGHLTKARACQVSRPQSHFTLAAFQSFLCHTRILASVWDSKELNKQSLALEVRGTLPGSTIGRSWAVGQHSHSERRMSTWGLEGKLTTHSSGEVISLENPTVCVCNLVVKLRLPHSAGT